MAISDYFHVTEQLYIAYLGRPADPQGLLHFATALNAVNAPKDLDALTTAYATSAPIRGLVNSFSQSAESAALYGTGDEIAYVSAIYTQMLGRLPDYEGLVYWSTAIRSGGLSRAELPIEMMTAAFFNTSNPAQAKLDQALINNKIAVGLIFTSELDTPVEIAGYVGNGAAQASRSMLAIVSDKTNVAEFQDAIDSTLGQILHGPRSPRTEFVKGTANDDVLVLGVRAAATGLEGKDLFDFRSNSSTAVIDFPTIADLSAGEKITFKDAGTYARSTLGAKSAIPDIGTLAETVDAALAGSVAGELRWFHYYGNTYVVNDASAAATFQAGSDQLIRLIGTHDLSASTVSDTGVFTYIGA